jgi:crotonobetainyl-CoA:carnitine CoA-transferase CaiB-like acyl-CoA transferase
MVVDVALQSGETVKMPGNPVKLSDGGEQTYSAPPLLGEHTEAVLADLLGYDPDMVANLRAQGAIQ